MCNVYGYARVSTTKQSIERQISNIKRAYPSAVVIAEEYTGTTTDRPKFTTLLKRLKQGDTLVFDEVSRMSRNAAEGFSLYQELYSKGINLVFLKEPHINTETYSAGQREAVAMTGTEIDGILQAINEYIRKLQERQIRLAFEGAQSEVDFNHKRTSEGVRRAQAMGKQVGRASGTTIETAKAKHCKAEIIKHSKTFSGTLADSELISMLRISRNTLYKYKREIKSSTL